MWAKRELLLYCYSAYLYLILLKILYSPTKKQASLDIKIYFFLVKTCVGKIFILTDKYFFTVLEKQYMQCNFTTRKEKETG